MNILSAIFINSYHSLGFFLMIAAIICLALLILNIGTRVNLLALALLLFFVALLTG